MRLWHKDLIPYLPNKWLVAQWRECCAIASRLAKNHDTLGNGIRTVSINHIIVNPVTEYDPSHFISYCSLVFKEAYERGIKISDKAIKNLEKDIRAWQLYLKDELPWELDGKIPVKYDNLFQGWHNDRYLTQCFYNLQEKYDRGGMTQEEWDKIQDWFM